MTDKELKRVTFYLNKDNLNKFELLKTMQKMKTPNKKGAIPDLMNHIIEEYYKNNNPDKVIKEYINKKIT